MSITLTDKDILDLEFDDSCINKSNEIKDILGIDRRINLMDVYLKEILEYAKSDKPDF